MNKKRIICAVMALVLVLGLTACGSKSAKEDTASADTGVTIVAAPLSDNSVGAKYRDAFVSSSATDASGMVKDLIAANIVGDLVEMEVEPGWLEGFSSDITGFSKAIRFSPMIGSIAFMGYVLETDDTNALVTSMQDAADPRWNICTEADETLVIVRDNLVFFLMCSNEG